MVLTDNGDIVQASVRRPARESTDDRFADKLTFMAMAQTTAVAALWEFTQLSFSAAPPALRLEQVRPPESVGPRLA